MKERNNPQAISLYIPMDQQERHVLKRLELLAAKRDRSINYLVVDAILRFLDREEAK